MTKVFPFDVVVSFNEDLSQDGLADGVVLGIELVKSMKGVTVLQNINSRVGLCFCSSLKPSWSVTHCMHVQCVNTQVEGCQVHTLKHLHERLAFALLHVHDIFGILLHSSLDKT